MFLRMLYERNGHASMFKGHHFERDKRHRFRFLPLLKIVLKFFLSDRMVHYEQFLGETVNTFLKDVERG